MSLRPLPALLAMAASLVIVGATARPASAAEGIHYRAELAAPASHDRLIVRDVVWKCGANACVAGKSSSRPVVDCTALVRKAGALRSFTVAGEALAAEQLEKCNAVARP